MTALSLVLDVLERIFNQGDVDAIDTAFHPDAGIHDPGHDMHGPAELRQGLLNLRQVFPDFHFTVLQRIEDGDTVALRYQGEGTHSAEFQGIPATGKHVVYNGMIMIEVRDGRIAEFWAQPDLLGVVRQLGGRMTL
jgi:steroid delta-isomerase-like uncharacterized protein